MKIKQEKIIYPVQSSFKILKYSVPYFKMQFHYHKEYELVYIIKGTGQRYIGNSIQKFKTGDMVLVGPELSHIWISQKENAITNSLETTEAIVLQFSSDLFSSLIETPEFASIKTMLINSHFGLKIVGETVNVVANLLEKLLISEGSERINLLINILDLIAYDTSLETLNPLEYKRNDSRVDDRVNAVYHYVKTFYHQKIGIKDVASLANMQESAFCRFFKEKTQRTFNQFLNETRVDNACKLLVDKNSSVSQIAYECGFNNMANFYRQFKKITGMSPGDYRK